MTYTQAKECIQELGRKGLEELIDRCSVKVIEAALECDITAENIEEAYAGKWKDDEEFT